MRNIPLIMVAAASGVICAEVITFTGADMSNPTNLASAANWSAPPTADAVGVIDLSQTPAVGYVANADMALKGLLITGNDGKTMTIAGDGTLSLGDAGYRHEGKASLALRCPVSVTADQTWDFGEGTRLETYSTISGTANLCISNFAQYVTHHATVDYGGRITYCRGKANFENRWIEYRGEGKWANAVHVANAVPLNLRPGNGKTVEWTKVFPVSSPTVASVSANIGLNVTSFSNPDTSGKVVFGDGADLSFTVSDATTPHYMTLAGHFRQTGGKIVKRQQYFLTLGHHAQDSSWKYAKPSLYSMEGGSLNVSAMLVGYNSTDESPYGNRFVQTGGTVTMPYSNNGANLQIGAGASAHYTVAEYQMGGGSLDVGGNGRSYNLALASPRMNNTVMPAAGFVMTGGTATSRSLTFGSDYRFWNEKLEKMSNAYALLDLSGGTLSFYGIYEGDMVANSWVHFCDSWNWNPAETNCFYSVKLHGGVLNLSGTEQTVWPLQTCFPKTEVGTVLGSADRNLAIVAPVHGTGIIRKEGNGGLLLTDATRFTGTLDVRGGVVSVEGTTEDVGASDVDCFRWTADSLAATYSDGDSVVDWVDTNNGIVATTNGNPAVERVNFKAPVFKASAYNGHAAVSFNNSSVSVPVTDNPIFGKKSFTVVAVFKTESKGRSATAAYANSLLAVYPGATHSTFAAGLVSDPSDTDTGSRFAVDRRFGGEHDTGRQTYASRSGVTLFDGDIHAVAMTLDTDKVTFTVDADRTETNYTGSAAVAPVGYVNKNYTDKKRCELMIGGHIVANASVVDGTAPFKGDLLELRVYTNRLFTAKEQRQITRKLLQVYDGSPARMIKLESGPNATGMGAPGSFTSWTPPAPVSASASWDADTVTGENGADVSEWRSEDGLLTASAAIAGQNAPKLIRNAINGHAALRFDSTVKTGLGVASEASPITGANDFTVALVWRSNKEGEALADSLYHAQSAAGLVSTKQAKDTSTDFSLSYRPGSAVMAGYGHTTADQSIRTRKPYRLNDGEVHISILACSGTDKKYRLMTDGFLLSDALANTSVRGEFDVLFGVYRPNATDVRQFFDGDIAAVKIYDKALTADEMRSLGEFWAEKYATHLLAGHRFSTNMLKESGLAATNVMVAADARLSLPLTDETPFTLGPGSRLSGAGGFMGSYRFSVGSVFDVSEEVPSVFDDLQLAGGTIRTARQFLANSNALHVRRVKVSGENRIQIDGTDDMPRRVVLFTFDEADVAEGATWTVLGAKTSLTSVVIDSGAKCATLVTNRGFTINIR